MGNELSEGCFRSKTLSKGRIPLYDMARVTPNNIQVKIHKNGQTFSPRDQEDKRKQMASTGKINEPILGINKKSCEITKQNLRSKTGRPLAKNGILQNGKASDQLKIEKKKVYSNEVKSQTASCQGNNSSSTNDSRRQSMIDSLQEKKSDSLNTSQISLSQFNLPEETIVHENEQVQKTVKTNDRHKDRLNWKTNDSKNNRSHEILDTSKYNSLEKPSGKQFLREKQKRRTQIFHEEKDLKGRERPNEKEGNNKRSRRQTESMNKSESSNANKKKKTWAHSEHAKNFNNYGL